MLRKLLVIASCLTLITFGVATASEEEDLAKATQNPVADLISLPFQNNINFDVGPREKTQNVLNIQPVWPVNLNEDWNLITRTIVPVISQPAMAPGDDREFGLGDTTFTAFLSPKKPGKWIWGVGPVVLLPTATDDALGSDKWGIGPSMVALTMPGKWVVGSLFSNVWSFTGSGDQDVNLFTWQVICNYNLPNGWYLTSTPIITSNWEADSSDKWTVPLGGGLGKIFRIGKLPINAQAQAFYNVEKPDYGPDWSLRLQVQLLFPKKK
ncbi:MAG: transporter [Deltaproteobacteria bacterium]|nr:transporter [Deltaproteobacteria bacterium]